MAATNWKEPKLLAYCLLNYCKWVHLFGFTFGDLFCPAG